MTRLGLYNIGLPR